jgi:hypothetical protein
VSKNTSILKNWQAYLTVQLAGFGPGRIVLHTFCLLRHPRRVRWHWQGIRRELTRKPQTFRTARLTKPVRPQLQGMALAQVVNASRCGLTSRS